jgi:hypothetical protein
MKRALEMERLSLSLSLRELYEGNQDGCLLYWGPRRICEGSGNGRLFQWGTPLLGNMEGRSFPRAFEKRGKFFT